MSAQIWLLLIYKVPSEPTARRVYVWRKLKGLGAILLHDSAWVLPATPRTREQFQWLSAEIREMGGDSYLWDATLTGGQDHALIAQFTALADELFREILVDLAAPSADVAALGRRYQQALTQDYFHAELGQKVRDALLRAREDEA